ncbi:HlyD family secretion protein [Erwinia sp. SLM-02]|uniref:HlyD family secretion protein n=1 Tax=Erwinia sp. SLM-02 TaxID=3020057 RepID=UPI0028D7E0AF|nr:efflux RND transporter periplasmic adaptor subunit [uncultured Erwinia sp.]
MKKTAFFTILLMAVAVAITVLLRAHSHHLLLQGEVDATEVIVSSKARGRVIDKMVRRGDDVSAGQPLIQLEAPELIAQLKAAEAARDRAQQTLNLSLNGTREETLRSLRAQRDQSRADYRNALATWQRDLSVASQGYISAQALDDARRSRDSALQQLQAAQANLDQGINGDRVEQRAAYAAQLRQAEQDLLEIKAQTDELLVRAPVAGEVGPIPAERGELLNAGSPLLTLIKLPTAWFVFDLREDILAHVRKGDKVTLRVPALNNQMIDAEVRYIAPLGDYATKRATRATGDFDLKTFEVRLYPITPVKDLRQGMSALWQWQE